MPTEDCREVALSKISANLVFVVFPVDFYSQKRVKKLLLITVLHDLYTDHLFQTFYEALFEAISALSTLGG